MLQKNSNLTIATQFCALLIFALSTQVFGGELERSVKKADRDLPSIQEVLEMREVQNDSTLFSLAKKIENDFSQIQNYEDHLDELKESLDTAKDLYSNKIEIYMSQKELYYFIETSKIATALGAVGTAVLLKMKKRRFAVASFLVTAFAGASVANASKASQDEEESWFIVLYPDDIEDLYALIAHDKREIQLIETRQNDIKKDILDHIKQQKLSQVESAQPQSIKPSQAGGHFIP